MELTPTPKQQEFLGAKAFEALFAGGPGGGKTQALIMAALALRDAPGTALLMRRSFYSLAGPHGLMDRVSDVLRRSFAIEERGNMRWRFPSGFELRFGHLESDEQLRTWDATPLVFLGMDDIEEIPEGRWGWMATRVRSGIARATSNEPPEWARKRFEGAITWS